MQAADVRLEDISKRFGELWAVRQVSFHIKRGEFYTLLGPSGCGKSTLLRTIAGFVSPDEGTVYLEGAAVNHIPPWERNVGMVFQNYALWPHMTVFENVAFGLRERKMRRDEIERRVRQTLEQVGLKGTEGRRPSQLSGGQQQRVAIARALAMDPIAMLFDEPTSALDPEMINEVLDVMVKLALEGMTMMVVTHEMGFARKVADRVVFMDEGRIQEDARTNEFFGAPRGERAQLFLSKILTH